MDATDAGAAIAAYPAIGDLPATQRLLADLKARPASVPAGALLFDEGEPCRGFPLVLSGEVKVARGSPSGRSIELYRVRPGEFCIVSAACLFGHKPLVAHAVATQATDLLLLSPEAFEAACADASFRARVLGTLADRLVDVVLLAEAVTFQRLDQRLATLLADRAPRLATTHQALAEELGTVREIVSRLLRRFEQAGWVALGRERIEVRDATALRALAQRPGGG